MASFAITVHFDSGIEKILYGDSATNLNKTIAVSDTTITTLVPLYMQPIFKSGYEIDTYTLNGSWITKNGDIFVVKPGVPTSSLVFTSELSTPRKSVDLTTLPGWANLSSGAHSIQLKAKASGYRDSELSQAVSVTKAAEGYKVTLNFNISGNSYRTSFSVYDSEQYGTSLLYEAPEGEEILTPLSVVCKSGYLFIFGDSEISPYSKVNSVSGGVTADQFTGSQSIRLIVTGDGAATITYYFSD